MQFSDTGINITDLLKATQFITEHHAGQTRKGSGLPYAIHPIRVATKITKGQDLPEALDQRTAVLAALLHDTLEDTQLTPEALTKAFGPKVLSVVKELTQDKSLPKAERRAQMLEHCKNYSLEAKVVKLADRWDNMSEMSGMSDEFIARYLREATIMLNNMANTWPQAESAIQGLIRKHQKSSQS